MTTRMKALCCTCGSLRTCSRPRNHRTENYWLARPVDRDWHRETGDLKCDNCARVTVHAIIHPDGDRFRDHAERLSAIALGMPDPIDEDSPQTRKRITTAYRQRNFPDNPYVWHKWWKSAENAAREAGRQWFPAMCGELVEVPETPCAGSDVNKFEAPAQISDPDPAEHESIDGDTGLWWTGGVCINCLRVRNNWLLQQRRNNLRKVLLELATSIDELDERLVNRLADLTNSLPGGPQ